MPEQNNDDDFSCIADIGAILQMLAGVIIIATQVINIFGYLSFLPALPSIPPSELPGIEFYLYLVRILIIVGVLIGGMLLLAGVISIWRSGPIGGLLAIIFAAPSFVVISPTYFVAPILGIIGGILSIAPSVRRPKPKSKRAYKQK
ncbi:MAG: hypothetical protein Q6361_01975 [Candidatus Hermodarchaeota archaeon]|nr:hypothetical protein [Candidatus Hermodarchaeota archaeon]